MYARVTLLEIDTVRLGMDSALERFREETLPRLRMQPGYRGVYVLTTPEGKAALMSLWDVEEEAASDAGPGFYGKELGHFATFFRSAPGRETYEVALVDERAPSR